MIRSFRNRALKRFWERADPKKLPPDDVDWRITFAWIEEDALDVDYEDYH